ncbi:hypothetical protein HF325_001083 [Metschnikowia pulcherrima]|uniref:Uncharacterized protein n=1 Tax=Metschnikowia pulcherrima TaxID=27326 RepID=A0A8H7GTU6_9ASCO|nr:hypothetical protein HF325_001083 [Metschnikowia pulcherrima]
MPMVSKPEIPEMKSLGSSLQSIYGGSSAFSFDADKNLVEMFIRKDTRFPSLPTPPPTATKNGIAKKHTNRLSTIFRASRNKAVRKAIQSHYQGKNEVEKLNGATPKVLSLAKPNAGVNPKLDIGDQELRTGVFGDSGPLSSKDTKGASQQILSSFPFYFQAGALEGNTVSRFFQAEESPEMLLAEAAALYIPEEFCSIFHLANRVLLERTAKQTKRGIPSCYRAYNFTRTIGSSIEEYLDEVTGLPTEFGPADFIKECKEQNWPNAFDSTSSIEDLGSYHEVLLVAATEISSTDDEGLADPALMASKISRVDTESQSGCGTLKSQASCASDEESRENHNEVFFSAPASPIFAAELISVPERAPEPISLDSLRVYEEARANIQARLASAGILVHDAVNVPERKAIAATEPLQPAARAQKAILCDTNDRSLGAGIDGLEMHGFLAEHYTSEMFAYIDSEYLA